MLDLWFVVSYVSHTTAVYFLHYVVSQAAFILPLSLEIAPGHDHGKLTTSCLLFVADLRDAIQGFHFADRKLSQLTTLQDAFCFNLSA